MCVKIYYQTYFENFFVSFAVTANEKKEKVAIVAVFFCYFGNSAEFFFCLIEFWDLNKVSVVLKYSKTN